MTSQQKEIIVISRNYPPMGGVGTRRWSKFTKYLATKGYLVHVITIDYKYKDTVNWAQDVDHPNIVVHRLKSAYPNWLLRHRKRGFFAKKRFELVRLFYQSTSNWMDNAQGWEKELIPYVRQLIRKNGIKNVVVTAAPCSVAYMTSIIKVENPEINFIVDFRDKWNDEPQYAYGTAIKSFKRKEKSVQMEMQTMLIADKIIVTTETIKHNFSSVHKTCTSKYVTIHNGFDADDYQVVWQPTSRTDNQLKLVYFGSLLGGQPEGLDLIYQAIRELNDPFFKESFKIDIYGVASAGYRNPDPATCFFKSLIKSSEVANVLRQYDCGLSILEMKRSNVFATKVFDYMAMKMPILHVSNDGELYHLLREKGQYVSNYNVESMKQTLLRLKQDFLDKKVTEADFEAFNISAHTSKVEELFE